MTKKKLYKARLSLVGIKAALFVSFSCGDRIAQDNAALFARNEFTEGGSAANAICAGYHFGMSKYRKTTQYNEV